MKQTIVLTIVGALFFYEGTRAQQFVVDGIKYNVTSVENRKVEVVGGYEYYRGDIVIPSNVEYDDVSYRVTSVGNDAFFFCNEMTSVEIPNSVTVIGDRAFAYCWNAGDIQVPDNVVSIGEEAFLVCSGIRNITIPASVTSIGNNAFALFSENDPDVNTYYIATLNWNSNLDFSSIASSFLGESNRVRDINVRQLVIGGNVTRFAFYDYSYDVHINYLKTIESITVDAQNPVFDNRNNCNAIINTSQNKLVAGLSNTVIPDDVTAIGECAFLNCDAITTITIPSSVTTIGYRAFAGCSSLESFTIPSGVNAIEYETFKNCSNLETIVIPAGVSSIAGGAFDGCSKLTADITIPAGMTRIENATFRGCGSLTSVTIPDGVTSIGYYAFSGCSALSSVTIPDGTTTIADLAFADCAGLSSLVIPSSVTEISNSAFYGCCGLEYIEVDAGNITYDSRNDCNAIVKTATNELVAGSANTVVPSDITSIGVGAFSDRTGLEELVLPNSLRSIGSSAFKNCINLESINIPDGVTSIGYSAFEGCEKLTSLDIPNSVTSIGTDAFEGCTGMTTVVLSGSITSIVDYAFRNCENLSSVVIPNSVTSIGNYAFFHCIGLTSITIPNSVTSIGRGAFSGTGLTSITVPSGITTINNEVFSGCSSLESVIIEEGVEGISGEAFAGCINLSSLYVPSTVTSVATNAFNQVNNIDYVYWNTNAVGLFTGYAQARKERHIGKLVIGKDMTEIQMANFWGGGISHFEVEEDNPVFDSRGDCDGIIITASNTLFKGCINTRIPNSVTAIGDNSLEDIYDLESITIPNSVVSIGSSSFAGCNNLTSLIIPSGVTGIGDVAFYNCSSLTSINLPDVTSIGNSCFRGCSRLASITIPESVESIGNNAFEGCGSLAAIVIPAGVTNIGNDAFKSTGLESIVVDAGNTVYDSRNNCNAIIRTETNELLFGSDNTVIPEGVERIKGYAFTGCSGLRSVFIPSSVTYIEDNAFEKTGLETIVVDGENDVYDSRNNCNAVIQTSTNTLIVGSKNTIIPSDVVSIKNAAFRGNAAIETLSIPDRVSSIGWSAFRGCSSLASVYVYSDDAPSLSGNTVFGENAAGRKFYVFSDLVESYRNASGWNNYYVDDIEAIPALTANNAGGTLGNWCTYYNGMASVKMPDDVIIYKASIDGERIVLTQVDGHIVSKGEAVLLNTNNSTIVLESAQGMIAGDFEGNSLRGVDYSAAQDENKTYYVLSKIGDDFGFYKLNPEVCLSPNKAYLEVDNRSLTQIRTFYSVGSTDGIVDGMVNINPAIDDTDGWYTIYGTKLIGKPVIKGLYIHNGQKVVVE